MALGPFSVYAPPGLYGIPKDYKHPARAQMRDSYDTYVMGGLLDRELRIIVERLADQADIEDVLDT